MIGFDSTGDFMELGGAIMDCFARPANDISLALSISIWTLYSARARPSFPVFPPHSSSRRSSFALLLLLIDFAPLLFSHSHPPFFRYASFAL